MIGRLAVKNLARNRRRTALTGLVLVAAIGVLVLGDGFISGLDESIIAGAVDGTVGHVLARPAGYPTQVGQHPVETLLTLSDEARRSLQDLSVAWTERLVFAPLAASGADAIRVQAIGYDPQRDGQVFPRTLWAMEGREPKPEADEIAVGRGVATLLRVKPGDRLVLQTRTHAGALNALEVEVAAVVSTRNVSLDTIGILVPGPLAARLVAAESPTHVALRLSSRAAAASVAAEVRRVLGPQAEVVTWEQETREMLELQTVRRKALRIVVFILLALGAFGIANTILMAAHERIREVGTLRAMGMTEGAVVKLFLAEGALLGLLGSVLGVLWGGALVAYWAAHPIDFGRAISQPARGGGLSVSAFVYTQLNYSVLAGAIAVGVVVAAVASVYPARVASRLPPAEAVRA